MTDATQSPPPEDPTRPTPPPSGQYPGAEPPPQPARPGVGQPADLVTRFVARLIDYIVLVAVNIVLVGIVVVGAIMGASGGMLGGGGFAAGAVTSILGAAIYLGYFALMESNRGQTIGKMVMKLETRGPGGGRPTLEQAIKRNAFTALGVIGIIPFLGWFLAPLAQLAAVVVIAVTINNNVPSRRGWHDDFAGGTSVVKVG
ncbi:MAG: RDD family protein [Nocardioidaceae bacterium]